ncbi:MAG: hypothetical protein PVG53_06795 [Holophagae bacterium]|jgi:hypothetical protein
MPDANNARLDLELGGSLTIGRRWDILVEEARDQANVRRADPTACEPESAAVMSSADVQEELQKEAAECLAAKEAMLAAETDEQFDLAKRKMDIFCND